MDLAPPDTEPGTAVAPVHTDWLRHALTISGPAEAMFRFRAAAAGPGVIPWVLDLAGMEEDWLLQLVVPPEGEPAISLSGAKILARRLRDATGANHARSLARVATDRRCPFDLHRLVPMPVALLALGPGNPAAQEWMWSHWGTTRALRRVRLLPGQADGRRRKTDRMEVEFWSADWSPWQAVQRIRKAWPDLILDLRPQYEEDRSIGIRQPGRTARQRRG
jgi:hypothetical protein